MKYVVGVATRSIFPLIVGVPGNSSHLFVSRITDGFGLLFMMIAGVSLEDEPQTQLFRPNRVG